MPCQGAPEVGASSNGAGKLNLDDAVRSLVLEHLAAVEKEERVLCARAAEHVARLVWLALRQREARNGQARARAGRNGRRVVQQVQVARGQAGHSGGMPRGGRRPSGCFGIGVELGLRLGQLDSRCHTGQVL